MAVFVFTLAFTFALGMKKHPVFYILSGVVCTMFAIELWNLIQSTILTTVIAGVGVMITVFGFVSKPSKEIEE